MIDGFLDGPSTVDTEGNLFIENRAGTGGGIYFKDATLRVVCDGLYNNEGVGIAGVGGNYSQDRVLDLQPGVDPRFCDLAGEDLRLHPESPFRVDGCERGALPVGCGDLP